MNNATWRYFTNTSNNSIEDAVRNTVNLDNMNGASHHTAVAYQSAAMNETYLVMDLDNNGYYETGIIFAGHIGGSPQRQVEPVLYRIDMLFAQRKLDA